jgi:hypothetical protein
MFYLCTNLSIFDTRVGGAVGRRHTDDHDRFVSRDHVEIINIDIGNDCIYFRVLSKNGIALMRGTTQEWTYHPLHDVFHARRGDVVSLHVVRQSSRPCRVDSLVWENMREEACFRVVTEDDLIAELETQLFTQ